MIREELIKEAYAYGVGVALVEAGFEKNAAAELAIEITNEELYKIAKKEEGMSTGAKAGIGALGAGAIGVGAGALLGGKRKLPGAVRKWLKGTNALRGSSKVNKVPGFKKLRKHILKQDRGSQGMGGNARTLAGIAGGAGGAALGGAGGGIYGAATKKD